MALITRRRGIIGLVVLIVVLVGVFVFVSRRHTNYQETTQAVPSAQYVSVTGFDVYGDVLDSAAISAIQDRLYQLIVQNGTNDTVAYSGEVRAGSFTVSSQTYAGQTPPIQVPTYTFIVDIPDAQQSYKVTYSGGTNYPYSILHVVCPSASDLKYGDFHCVDSEQ
jgi:hypothetical protein